MSIVKALSMASGRVAGLLCALTVCVPAHAQMTWRSAPEIAIHEGGAGGHGHGHSRRPATVYLRDGAGAALTLWKPNVEQSALPTAKADGEVAVRPSGVDNYHLLMASRAGESSEEVALRYVYMHGKPSGESPRRLLGAQKAALEIVPAPLPREHWRYETSKRAVFEIRLTGTPLAGQPVQLVTTHGSLVEGVSDEQGRVTFVLPEDFAHVAPGREANAPAEFIVSTAHTQNGFVRRTTLTAEYHANPAHWQSSVGGVVALMVGFIGGMALWRRLPAEDRA
jgi:hypothetical protein